MDTFFEVKWKSGDVTWIPHYEISHLQALRAYLDAQGVEKVEQLPPGKGNPPETDAQFSIDRVEINFITPTTPVSFKNDTDLHIFSLPCLSTIRSHSANIFLPRSDSSASMGKQQQQQSAIPHPSFHRQSRYLIQVRPPGQPAHLWHVSHIHELIKYSDAIVNHSGPMEGILRRTPPFGYELVATTWNTNAPATLRKRLLLERNLLSPSPASPLLCTISTFPPKTAV